MLLENMVIPTLICKYMQRCASRSLIRAQGAKHKNLRTNRAWQQGFGMSNKCPDYKSVLFLGSNAFSWHPFFIIKSLILLTKKTSGSVYTGFLKCFQTSCITFVYFSVCWKWSSCCKIGLTGWSILKIVQYKKL